jgi:3-hydroxyacyl-[acyl-carrier-protein] dehydratase
MSTLAEALGLLPHRPPFLFLDEIDDLVPGEAVTARYRVRGTEPLLAGHFPGRPTFPGVLQIEALAQAGAVAVLACERFRGTLPLLAGVDGVRLRRQVVPGDELSLRVEVVKLSGRAGRADAVAEVDGTVTCSARLLFALAPAVDASPPGATETVER